MDLIFFSRFPAASNGHDESPHLSVQIRAIHRTGSCIWTVGGGKGGRTEKDRRRKGIMLYDEMNITPLFSRIRSALTTNRDSMIMTLQFQQIKSCLRFKALMMMMIMMKLMGMRSMIEGRLCSNR
jgi:hypothetical protein